MFSLWRNVAAAVLAAVCSIVKRLHHQVMCRLHDPGKPASRLPFAGLPALFIVIFHKQVQQPKNLKANI